MLAERGSTVGHCPYKYAKMAMTLHSFQRYLDAGVTLALGTDTYPLDIVSELRWASILARVTDANYQAGLARDVFNAATLGGCRFLGREDLGRLAPGAKADILLINLDHVGGSVYADPIKALVDSASGRDVDTAIVDGQVLVQGGRATRVDEDAVLREGARGHPALLEPRAGLAVGRRRRGPDRSARLPDPPGARVRRPAALGFLLLLAVCAHAAPAPAAPVAEAGHPQGFDAGELSSEPFAASGIGEPVVNDLKAVGIRLRLRPLERAAFLKQYGDKSLKHVILAGSGAPGTAATRLEQYVISGGLYTYTTIPEVDGLYSAQATELNPRARRVILDKMQQIIHDRVLFGPVLEYAYLVSIGPRLEVDNLNVLPQNPYTAPYEELRIRAR